MKKTIKKKNTNKVDEMSEECIEKCKVCGNSDVDLETMPCCGELICWYWCLYEMPEECPLCGASINVEPNDDTTEESYVEVIIPTVELTKEARRLLKECKKTFDQKKLPSDSDIIERALRSYLCNKNFKGVIIDHVIEK